MVSAELVLEDRNLPAGELGGVEKVRVEGLQLLFSNRVAVDRRVGHNGGVCSAVYGFHRWAESSELETDSVD